MLIASGSRRSIDMYNVLKKLRGGQPFNAKEKTIHEQGLVSVLKLFHDDLDAAVFAAYGWSPSLSDEEILEKLVALNAERAAEEAQGLVRRLRPEYQAGGAVEPVVKQGVLIGAEEVEAGEPGSGASISSGQGEKMDWPRGMAEQAQVMRQALLAAGGAVTAKQGPPGLPALVRRGWRNCWKRWRHWARRVGWRGAGSWGSNFDPT